jgi:Short C-terminal domain
VKLFGRKRKPEEDDGLGLPAGDEDPGPSGLGSASVSVGPPSPSVSPPTAPQADNPIAELQSMAGGISTMGSGAALAQLLTGRGPVGELVKEIRSDPQGFRRRIMEQAGAAGGNAFVLTPQGLTPIGHPPGAPVPEHVDVIDELTKAADLHAKGALTDEEFEKLKHRLLSSSS